MLGSATVLYGLAGGDRIVPLLARRYRVKNLGSPPSRGGWWGNTHVTAKGLVRFYAKVKSARRVGPWLIHAMRHATVHGSDGTYQYYGIPAAASSFATKQGWGADSNCGCTTVFNSTGYVDGSRFAAAMLTSGGAYGRRAMTTLDGMAQRLMPGGHIDAAWHNPVLTLTTASSLELTGWTYDPDAPSSSNSVRVRQDGAVIGTYSAGVARPDIDAKYGIAGQHGFDVIVAGAAPGRHEFCAYGTNLGAPVADPVVKLGCSTQTVQPAPTGP